LFFASDEAAVADLLPKFSGTRPDDIYVTAPMRRLFRWLLGAFERGAGIYVVTGCPEAGKSVLAIHLASEREAMGHRVDSVSAIPKPGAAPTPSDGDGGLRVMIFDAAEVLPSAVLADLHRLLGDKDSSAVRVVLIGRPLLLRRLLDPQLAAIER